MQYSELLDLAPDVSRETFEDLKVFSALLQKWNKKINLVARDGADDIWTRHIVDSLQVISHIPKDARVLADLGSGGGFPGLVIALVMRDRTPDLDIILIDSDKRKCEFLRSVARELKLDITVHAARILDVPPVKSDVVTARALAPLQDLLGFAQFHMVPGGRAIFLKGERFRSEIEDAKKQWSFSCDIQSSLTHPDAAVLKIGDIERA